MRTTGAWRQRWAELARGAPKRLVAFARDQALQFVAALRSMPVATCATLLGLALVARLAWMQLASLNLPIASVDGHHWRQSFTYGVAWNYAHTTHDILRPRMFLELKSSNIV